MADLKADSENVWVKARFVGTLVTITAASVVLYMRFDQRMSDIEKTMARDVDARTSERRELRESMDGLRGDLRKVFVDSVAARQAQSWIELARALNKEKFPALQWPDLPR